MSSEEERVVDTIDEKISSLDRWVDAIKDISLVSVGIVASYVSLALGGRIETTFILVILAVSILSSMFLPYKLAVTKKSVMGVFSRSRAIELMIVILICWMVPTTLILAFPQILTHLPPQSDSTIVSRILTLGLPQLAFLLVIIITVIGMRPLYLRIGLPNDFMEKYEKFPWGLNYLSLYIVSLTVVSVQLRLLEAVQTYTYSIDLGINIYSQVFGGLIVLTLSCCVLAYFEPERILTTKGELLFGFIATGLFLASVIPTIGIIIAITGVLILTWYSLSLPPLNIDQVVSEKEFSKNIREMQNILFRIRYGRHAVIVNYFIWIFGILTFGMIIAATFFPDLEDWYFLFMMICFFSWAIIYFRTRTIKLNLYKRVYDYWISHNKEELDVDEFQRILFESKNEGSKQM